MRSTKAGSTETRDARSETGVLEAPVRPALRRSVRATVLTNGERLVELPMTPPPRKHGIAGAQRKPTS